MPDHACQEMQDAMHNREQNQISSLLPRLPPIPADLFIGLGSDNLRNENSDECNDQEPLECQTQPASHTCPTSPLMPEHPQPTAEQALIARAMTSGMDLRGHVNESRWQRPGDADSQTGS